MSETLTLDPIEECPDRVEVDLTTYVGGAGPDFGDAQIEAYRSQASVGESVIDFRMPNRTVTIPLVVRSGVGVTFDALRSMLQAKCGLLQREGGVLKRETSVGTVYADIQTAALKLGGSTAQAVQDVDVDAVLTLEVTPDWYGPWIDLGDEDGAGEVIRLLTTDRGDHPGRMRIVVTDAEGVEQHGLIWGIRSRHYDPAATAALVYEAESLTPLDTAAVATVTGASGGVSNNVIRHAALATDWTPVLLTDILAGAPLTHTGSYRIWARVYTTSSTPPRLRFAWDVGDLTDPITNSPTTPPAAGSFYRLDLGTVRIDPAPLGSHRWRGMIQAIGAVGGENLSVDKIWLEPTDEYAGTLRAPIKIDVGLQAFTARDTFSQSPANLNGLTATVGGTWATAGDATDYAVSSGVVLRGASGDSGVVGRVATLGSATPSVATVRSDFSCSALTGFLSGILLRYVDVNNFLLLALNPVGAGLYLAKVIGGSVAAEWSVPYEFAAGESHTIQVFADAAGNVMAWASPRGEPKGDALIVAWDAALATGGALDDGKVGLYDFGAAATVRSWDNFAAWVPEPDAVIHPNQALELRTDGADRENPDGGSYGPVSWVAGDLPRLPAPGLESRETELLVAVSRGDLDRLPDSSPDDALTVAVQYRPSYLYVPDGGPGS